MSFRTLGAGLALLCSVIASMDGQVARARRAPIPYKGVVVTFHGALKKVTKKEILIQSDEDQLLTMRCSNKTKFYDHGEEIKATGIDLESRVSIDATQDSDLKLLAIKVAVEASPRKSLGK